ncbi:hypothetical protein F4703DRAFT_1932956 [Phycomyces blakesleeanus]
MFTDYDNPMKTIDPSIFMLRGFFLRNNQYAAAKLFSGCILRDTINGHSILVNTVEVYGCTNNPNIYSESFGKVKDGVVATSLPSTTFKPLYPGVWPATLQKFDGMKLIIGIRTSNVLVASRIRLDTKEDLLVGSVNLGFQLMTFKDSMITKLRQLRSRFDKPSGYTLCRASGSLADVNVCQTFITFTLADYDKGRDTGVNLFRLIEILVLKHGQAALPSKVKCQRCYPEIHGQNSNNPLINAISVSP